MVKEKGTFPEGRCTSPQPDCTSSPKKKQRKSQKTRILEYLEEHGSITQAEAVERFRCYRLSARISELKDDGHNIITESEPNNGYGRHARYFLEE